MTSDDGEGSSGVVDCRQQAIDQRAEGERWILASGRRQVDVAKAVSLAEIVLQPSSASAEPARYLFTHKTVGVIVPGVAADEFKATTEFAEFWTPTLAEVEDLERRLPAYLAATKKTTPGFLKRLPQYLRQYFGVVVEGRRHVLMVGQCPAGIEPTPGDPYECMFGFTAECDPDAHRKRAARRTDRNFWLV